MILWQEIVGRGEWIDRAWQLRAAGAQIDPSKPPSLKLKSKAKAKPENDLPEPFTPQEKAALIPWMEKAIKRA